MSKQREALELALQALEEIAAHYPADWEFDICIEATKLAREALAEPARKPLTDEEIERLLFESHRKPGNHRHNFARLIERAHGITQPTEENT